MDSLLSAPPLYTFFFNVFIFQLNSFHIFIIYYIFLCIFDFLNHSVFCSWLTSGLLVIFYYSTFFTRLLVFFCFLILSWLPCQLVYVPISVYFGETAHFLTVVLSTFQNYFHSFSKLGFGCLFSSFAGVASDFSWNVILFVLFNIFYTTLYIFQRLAWFLC